MLRDSPLLTSFYVGELNFGIRDEWYKNTSSFPWSLVEANPTLLIIVVLMFYLEVESRDNLSDRQTLNLLVAYLVQWNTEINAVVSLLHMIYKLSCQTYISSFLSLPQFILTTSLSSFNNTSNHAFANENCCDRSEDKLDKACSNFWYCSTFIERFRDSTSSSA